MVPVTFLRQRTSKLKVPGNNSPRFLDWRVPLLQTVATPVEVMTGTITNNLMQSLILPIIATSGQLKQNSSMFRHGMSFDFHKTSKQLPKFLSPAQGPAKNHKSEDLVCTCLAIPPRSLIKSSTKVMVTTCGPLWRARPVARLGTCQQHNGPR